VLPANEKSAHRHGFLGVVMIQSSLMDPRNPRKSSFDSGSRQAGCACCETQSSFFALEEQTRPVPILPVCMIRLKPSLSRLTFANRQPAQTLCSDPATPFLPSEPLFVEDPR